MVNCQRVDVITVPVFFFPFFGGYMTNVVGETGMPRWPKTVTEHLKVSAEDTEGSFEGAFQLRLWLAWLGS